MRVTPIDPSNIRELAITRGACMRIFFAVVIAVGGILVSHSTADARESRRSPQPPQYNAPPSSAQQQEQAVCEERAQNADPAGIYAGYPCWAQESFSRRGR